MNKYIKLDNIYHLFWLITHSIISLIVLINRYYKKLFKSKKYRQKDINILVNYLNKIPKHIAICINEELLDCHQLSQLIRWCQQFGVTYVSLFSNNGINCSNIGFTSNPCLNYFQIYLFRAKN